MLFEFATNVRFQFRGSRYTTWHNRTSELKVIAICICFEFPFSITSASIYYRTQSDIQVKSYCRLNLPRAFVFKYERLNILWDAIRHPCKKLLSCEFAQSICFQFRESRYITGFNLTSELKVIVVWICSKLLFLISSIMIYYGTQSDIRVKRYCR